MRMKLCNFALIALFLTSCHATNTITVVALTSVPTSTHRMGPATPEFSVTTQTLSPTIAISPTADPGSLTAAPTPIVQPLIHEQPGDLYETIFTIPEGDDEVLQYFEGAGGNIIGPTAIAVLPDNSFLIADPNGNHLLHYDQAGQSLGAIDLGELGIKNAVDMRRKGNQLFLLEIGYEQYHVHRLTLDGTLVASDEIPYHFPVEEYTLGTSLTGIAIDCEGNIILEVKGGANLYPLAWVQTHPDSTGIAQGYLCNGQRYWVSGSSPPRINAGNVIYKTRLTTRLGYLYILDVYQDDSIYMVRSDLLAEKPGGQLDQTVHYLSAGGVVQGVARVPRFEAYYSVRRSMAVGPKGEVFVLLPRPNSVDIIRLNFYKELEPLIPGAVIPQITIVSNNP